MNGEILKQFLVSLGFGVDEGSLKKFNKAIDNAYVRVGLFAGAIKTAAAGIFAGISKISSDFEEMGYQYRIIAPAINKALLLRRALLDAYKGAGINIVSAVQNSVKFNMSLAKTKFQLEAVYKSVGMKFVPMLTKQMDEFRKKVSANMPKIIAFLERIVRFIFKASEAVTALGMRLWSMLSRVWEALVNLDQATGGWSTKIIALIAAWRLLNLSFLATPIGMVITGVLALLALYDDLMTWKEGGESLFDWGNPAVQTILGVVSAVIGAIAIFKTAMVAMSAYRTLMLGVTVVTAAFKTVMTALRIAMLFGMLNPIGLTITAIGALIGLVTLLITKWDVIKEGVGKFFNGIGGKVMDLFGGEGGDINVNRPSATLGSSPSSAGVSGVKQDVKQETNIIVQGNSDPRATAALVAGQQDRVNFNLARNMKGAVQ